MSTFDRQAILESLSRLVTPGIKLTALADELGVRKHDYETLRSTVLELVEEGSVHVLPGGAFALAPHGRTPDPHAKPVPPPPPEPRAHKKDRHKRRDREQEAPKRARKAELPWKKPAAPARPLSQPAEEYAPETGELRRGGRAVYLEPDDPRIAADYGRVGIDSAPLGKDGDAVVIEITRYPDPVRNELAGKVLKVLGDPEDPRTEIEKILACAENPIEFPDAAAAQAPATPQELTPADLADRIDLRDRRFATIDPETARDFDDALCIETGPHGGPRVWVAVADVSHYVRWNDALDREASIRGVSVYLPDRVIPLLPFQLSAQICSLNPLVDRCAMVVRLDYDDDANVVDIGYAAAAIKSKARLDYPGVAAALGGDFRGARELFRPWIGELTRLHELAQKLRAKRQARGALELDIAEPKLNHDADEPRHVREVVKAMGDPAVKMAYQLVEEFMTAANVAVGMFFGRRYARSVWRVVAPR